MRQIRRGMIETADTIGAARDRLTYWAGQLAEHDMAGKYRVVIQHVILGENYRTFGLFIVETLDRGSYD